METKEIHVLQLQIAKQDFVLVGVLSPETSQVWTFPCSLHPGISASCKQQGTRPDPVTHCKH